MGRKEVDSSFGQRNNPDQKIFFDQGYTNRLMVETKMIEPLTSTLRTQRSHSLDMNPFVIKRAYPISSGCKQ
jgi:hypothetical protein